MSAPAQTHLQDAGSTSPTAIAIETEGMSARNCGAPAVRNLSMHVPRGSIYGLVGPNGSGKSTTLRTLATLQQPDAGKVTVDGIDVKVDPAAVRARVGYLPDFFGVYESLTVDEHLDFYGASYRIPASRRRAIADELLELLDLTGRRNDPVKRLSRGLRQRLGLARCLIHDPPILLLDEPASGLDPASRLELRDILQELAGLGKTVLISSHVLGELGEMCTYVGVIRAGEMLAEGTMDDLGRWTSAAAQLRIRLLSSNSAGSARRVLEAHPACDGIVHDGASTLLVQFSGTESDLAEILRGLVAAGASLTEFVLERGSLREIFASMMLGGSQA